MTLDTCPCSNIWLDDLRRRDDVSVNGRSHIFWISPERHLKLLLRFWNDVFLPSNVIFSRVNLPWLYIFYYLSPLDLCTILNLLKLIHAVVRQAILERVILTYMVWTTASSAPWDKNGLRLWLFPKGNVLHHRLKWHAQHIISNLSSPYFRTFLLHGVAIYIILVLTNMILSGDTHDIL